LFKGKSSPETMVFTIVSVGESPLESVGILLEMNDFGNLDGNPVNLGPKKG
jgi:hypothetical protein